MDLVDRYLHEVSVSLPERLRDEVTTELSSTIDEAIERRREQHPAEDPDETIVAVLRELGPPAQLAASYHRRVSFLVGPALYPAFKTTLAICLSALAVLLLIGLLSAPSGAESPGAAFAYRFVDAIGGFLDSALTVIGLVALVFFVLERTSSASRTTTTDWDPTSMPAIEDPNRVSRLGLIVKVALLAILVYWVNFTSHGLIGSFLSTEGRSGWVPFLSPDLGGNLWLLNLVLGFEVALGLLVLRQGRWQPLTRWLELGTTILFAILLLRLAFGTGLVAVDSDWMEQSGWSPETAAQYVRLAEEILSPILAVALQIGFVGTCIVAVVQMFRLVTGRYRQIS
jgi:hypothetical protein